MDKCLLAMALLAVALAVLAVWFARGSRPPDATVELLDPADHPD